MMPKLCLLMGLLMATASAFVPVSTSGNKIPPTRYYYTCYSQPALSSSSTQLQMGLRNFVKRKVLRRKGDSPDQPGSGADSDDTGDSNDRFTTPQAPSALGTTTGRRKPKPDTISTRDTNKIIQKAAATKAAKEEPNKKAVRMGEDKNGNIDIESNFGPETPKDRISRIKRGDMSQQEKEAFLKSALNTGNTPQSRLPLRDGKDDTSSEDAKASPFPKDSILRSLASGNKPYYKEGTSSERPSPVIDSQSKKRQYLDMVTNPKRFDNLSSGASTAKISPGDMASASNNGDDNDSAPAIEEPNLPQDLGARLGAAAMANEKRNKENKKRQMELKQKHERDQKQRLAKLAQAQQHRQEELAKREVEILQRRRVQESKQAHAQQQSQQVEEARRAELMKAQDDYWARKLAEDKAGATVQPAVQSEPEVKAVVEEDDGNNDEEVVSEEDYSVVSPPSRSNEEVFGRPSLNDVSTRASDYQTDQRRKKAAQQDQQLARLRSMNSPLPQRAQKASPRPIRKAAFEPQVPVKNQNRDQAATPAQSQSLGDLTNTIKNSVTSTPSPPPPAPVPVVTPAPAKVAPAKSSGSNSMNPFARFGGGGGNKATAPKPAPAPIPAPVPAPMPVQAARPPPPAPRPAPAPPARKGPIRMELPGVEDEEEPADMTEGMTIGEIMKRQKASGGADQDKRSKQWGVDMSRFSD